jgi:hypothetical protein
MNIEYRISNDQCPSRMPLKQQGGKFSAEKESDQHNPDWSEIHHLVLDVGYSMFNLKQRTGIKNSSYTLSRLASLRVFAFP